MAVVTVETEQLYRMQPLERQIPAAVVAVVETPLTAVLATPQAVTAVLVL
jgi:hypothetical protein